MWLLKNIHRFLFVCRRSRMMNGKNTVACWTHCITWTRPWENGAQTVFTSNWLMLKTETSRRMLPQMIWPIISCMLLSRVVTLQARLCWLVLTISLYVSSSLQRPELHSDGPLADQASLPRINSGAFFETFLLKYNRLRAKMLEVLANDCIIPFVSVLVVFFGTEEYGLFLS